MKKLKKSMYEEKKFPKYINVKSLNNKEDIIRAEANNLLMKYIEENDLKEGDYLQVKKEYRKNFPYKIFKVEAIEPTTIIVDEQYYLSYFIILRNRQENLNIDFIDSYYLKALKKISKIPNNYKFKNNESCCIDINIKKAFCNEKLFHYKMLNTDILCLNDNKNNTTYVMNMKEYKKEELDSLLKEGFSEENKNKIRIRKNKKGICFQDLKNGKYYSINNIKKTRQVNILRKKDVDIKEEYLFRKKCHNLKFNIKYDHVKEIDLNKYYIEKDIYIRYDDKVLKEVYAYNNKDNIRICAIYDKYCYINGVLLKTITKDILKFNKKTYKFYSVMNYTPKNFLKLSKEKIEEINVSYVDNKKTKFRIKDDFLELKTSKFLQLIVKEYYSKIVKDKEYYYTKKDLISKNYKEKYIFPTYIRKKKYNIQNTYLALLLMYIDRYSTNKNGIYTIKSNILKNLKKLGEKNFIKKYKISEDLHELNFEYIVNKIVLIDLNVDYNHIKSKLDKHCISLLNCEHLYRKRNNALIEYLKQNNIDFVMKNFFNKKTNSLIFDFFDIYYQIRKNKKDYVTDMKNKTILKIHDNLSIDYNRLKIDNEIIPKEEKLYKLIENKTVNVFNQDITFTTAKDTHELIGVGTKMSICVGSYREKALKQNCFIVVGYNKDKEPKMCVEIIKKNKTYSIEQVKLYKNNLCCNDDKLILQDFFNTLKIESNCHDLRVFSEKRMVI